MEQKRGLGIAGLDLPNQSTPTPSYHCWYSSKTKDQSPAVQAMHNTQQKYSPGAEGHWVHLGAKSPFLDSQTRVTAWLKGDRKFQGTEPSALQGEISITLHIQLRITAYFFPLQTPADTLLSLLDYLFFPQQVLSLSPYLSLECLSSSSSGWFTYKRVISCGKNSLADQILSDIKWHLNDITSILCWAMSCSVTTHTVINPCASAPQL